MKKSELRRIIREEITNELLGFGDITKKVKDAAASVSNIGIVGKMLNSFKKNGYPMDATVSNIALGIEFSFENKKYALVSLINGRYSLINTTTNEFIIKDKDDTNLKRLLVGFLLSKKDNQIILKNKLKTTGTQSRQHLGQLEQLAKKLANEDHSLMEGWFKNLAMTGVAALSLATTSPKAQAASGNVHRIEYSKNISRSRQVEIQKAFKAFLDRCEKENSTTDQSEKVKGLLDKKAYDQIVYEFMAASDENDEVAATPTETEFLIKNFVAIAQTPLDKIK